MVHLAGAGGAPKLLAACEDFFICSYAGEQALSDQINQDYRQSFFIYAVYQVAKKLREIHNCNISHNDLKADNIVFDEVTRQYSIIDYGLSTRMGDCKHPITDPKEFKRVNWLAPEIKRGANVTPAGDIYSLGMLLGHILGEFKDPNPRAMIAFGKATQEDPRDRPSLDEFIGLLGSACDSVENDMHYHIAQTKLEEILAHYKSSRESQDSNSMDWRNLGTFEPDDKEGASSWW